MYNYVINTEKFDIDAERFYYDMFESIEISKEIKIKCDVLLFDINKNKNDLIKLSEKIKIPWLNLGINKFLFSEHTEELNNFLLNWKNWSIAGILYKYNIFFLNKENTNSFIYGGSSLDKNFIRIGIATFIKNSLNNKLLIGNKKIEITEELAKKIKELSEFCIKNNINTELSLYLYNTFKDCV